MRTQALERAIGRAQARRRTAPVERCALCAAELAEHHPHLVDVDAGRPICVCGACAVLFDRPAAGPARYRLPPERRQRVSGVEPASLGVPVGLAFFVRSGDGVVSAHYPSPAGATRWEVDASAWAAATDRCDDLLGLEPEVEALLVNTVDGRCEAWIVPITDCYRLVAVVRTQWQGLSGGDAVWPAIEGFFEALRRSHGKDPRR
jgi:hypothetical protein